MEVKHKTSLIASVLRFDVTLAEAFQQQQSIVSLIQTSIEEHGWNLPLWITEHVLSESDLVRLDLF
jgi:hypothetical protein